MFSINLFHFQSPPGSFHWNHLILRQSLASEIFDNSVSCSPITLKYTFQIELETLKKECFIRCFLQQRKKKNDCNTLKASLTLLSRAGSDVDISYLNWTIKKDIVFTFLVTSSLFNMLIWRGCGLVLGWGFLNYLSLFFHIFSFFL